MNFFDYTKPLNAVPADAKIIFVADLFAEDYAGGAELTTQALIDSSPYKVHKIKSKDVTKDIVSANRDKVWVFGNMTQMNPQVAIAVMASCKYVILEYDYKYCAHRSPEKHASIELKPCDCESKEIGDFISSFFHHANAIFWMSEKQQQLYRSKFPFLEDNDQIVLSSVFDDDFFAAIKLLREKHKDHDRKEWLVLRSGSWIKGSDAGVEYCKKKGLPYREIGNLSYADMLEELVKAKGLVFLPPGGDTCPRLVIEAKLLGCDLVLNENVQHASEEWFDTDDLGEIEEYLYGARSIFWNFIKNSIVEKVPKLSGYTTTYNCISQEYPFEECISSMLGFCDEVCVVDGGSNDGTWELLKEMSKNNPKIQLQLVARDWTHPRFAMFDGMQKAEARRMCTGDYCWQMDSDEVVDEKDFQKVRDLVANFPRGIHLVSLPVVEYWGGPNKVRLDVTPWKWRLSRNLPTITHGVPVTLRRVFEDGTMGAAPGTDGCDMIHSRTGEPIPFLGFLTEEANQLRAMALQGDEAALRKYQNWFSSATYALPSVHHFSWYDMSRKIKTYKNYWGKHWRSLYGEETQDTAENNMFFDVPWSEVTDEMIDARAKELADNCGGWIWHSKYRGQRTPWMKMGSPPDSMKKFYDGRKR